MITKWSRNILEADFPIGKTYSPENNRSLSLERLQALLMSLPPPVGEKKKLPERFVDRNIDTKKGVTNGFCGLYSISRDTHCNDFVNNSSYRTALLCRICSDRTFALCSLAIYKKCATFWPTLYNVHYCNAVQQKTRSAKQVVWQNINGSVQQISSHC